MKQIAAVLAVLLLLFGVFRDRLSRRLTGAIKRKKRRLCSGQNEQAKIEAMAVWQLYQLQSRRHSGRHPCPRLAATGVG